MPVCSPRGRSSVAVSLSFVVALLASFIEERGGSIDGGALGDLYKKYEIGPIAARFLSGGKLRSFCQSHRHMFTYVHHRIGVRVWLTARRPGGRSRSRSLHRTEAPPQKDERAMAEEACGACEKKQEEELDSSPFC